MIALGWRLGWNAGWPDPELRKSFEVALHGGAAAAWLLSSDGRSGLRGLLDRHPGFLLLAVAPPAAAGLALEQRIQRQLDRPRLIAAGLTTGAVALAVSDRRPQSRAAQEAGPLDALWLGAAQACALVPGVSRSGASVAAARMRRFTRRDARRLSAEVGLPVIAGAVALKMLRMTSGARQPGQAAALLAGAAASFGSTLLAGPVLARYADTEPLMPYAGYRLALALLIVRRGSRARRRRSARA